MTHVDPFDILRRLSAVPVMTAVDALRQIHGRGAAPDVDALRRLLGIATEARPPSASVVADSPAAAPAQDRDYEAARKHFVQHAQRLREQATLAERLLHRLVDQPCAVSTASLTHEVHIAGAPGDTASARVVVANYLERPVHVRFRVGHVHGLPASASPVAIRFAPERPLLAVAGECEVAIVVGVPAEVAEQDRLEFGVEVFGNERPLCQLWVCVDVRTERRETVSDD